MKKFVTISVCFLLALSMMLSMASCAASIHAEDLSAGYERQNDKKEVSVGDGFREALADFSFDLLGSVEMVEGENALLSPMSALACLALIAGGADGETLAELEAAIGMDEETLREGLYAYLAGLSNTEDCKFKMANSIWTRDTNGFFHVKESFLQKTVDWYDAQIYRAPFDESTVKDINTWVEENTDGMIREIIDRLEPTSMMVLINTLVFDAKWQEQYEKYQIDEYQFTSYRGEKTRVNMMSSEEHVYLEMEGAIGFAKDYKGRDYSFVALLPEEGRDVYAFARGISGEAFLEMWDGKTYRTVNARIPEFSYEDDLSLREAMGALGVVDLFDPIEADLTGMGSYDDGDLYISALKQKTFIDVSPNGTKAAAVTWGIVDATSAAPPTEIINIFLDRPFVYAIVDNATGLPLFVGVVASVAK